MNAIVTWFAGNRVAAILFSVTIAVAGLVTLGRQTVEVFPEFAADVITINVPYPGASPAEVEEAIVIRIEERVADLPGIKRLFGTAREGLGSVAIQVVPGQDVRALLDDVKVRVDAIDTFPEEAERPIVEQAIRRNQVIDIAVHGDAGERVLKRTAERIRDELQAIPGITLVDVSAVRADEIAIEISESSLRRHALTFDAVAQAARRGSLDLPAGNLRTEAGDVLLRTRAQAYTGHEFASIPVLTRTDGTVLTIGDVAQVRDGFAENDLSARFDGEPTAVVKVYRVGEQNALDIARLVKEYVANNAASLPAGVQMTVWNDFSVFLSGRINLLLSNGLQGFILVLLCLSAFLRARIAFWVALGVPIAICGGLWIMPLLGVTINMISLFAFILVLGILVDDAIVVGEHITHLRAQGVPPLEAAKRGVREVALPVTLSVLTTIAMFTPMLGIEGFMGRIWMVIPAIAIPTLAFSLLESLFVLPSHLAHSPNKPLPGLSFLDRIPDALNRALDRFLERGYRPFITLVLRHRYAAIAAFLASLAIAIALVATGRVPFSFFPRVPADLIIVSVTMPPGTGSAQTGRTMDRIETAALAVRDQLEREAGPGTVRHIMTTIGGQPMAGMQHPGGPAGSLDPTAGEVVLALAPTEDRTYRTEDIERLVRETVGPVPEALSLTFSSSAASAGRSIEVELSGPDLDEVLGVTATLKEALSRVPGVYGIGDSDRSGKREVIFALRPEAEGLGLTELDVARQVRQAVYGEEVQRIQRGRDEVAVFVRFPQAERTSLGDLENLRLRTADGQQIPLPMAAATSEGAGFTIISRANRQRIITVTADIDEVVASTTAINADLASAILPRLLADHPRISFSQEGESREMRESVGSIVEGFKLALYICFVLVAVLFRSILQPLIILSIIPFGLVGAMLGNLMLGIEFSIMTLMGLVALSGIEVNDSILLVDFINRSRREGMSLHDAVRESGCRRFRAILLTTLTTFLGLVPVIIAGQLSVQARFLVPMAVALGFGGLFVTFITLILVPSLYLVVEDVRHLFGLGEYRGGLDEE